ncbi:MAG: hypothetical protein LQ342_006483 [Letrouitia transgressa]|nr:MAG: hypothetical protein LQ342_006483 [Letrouitia transgressa]
MSLFLNTVSLGSMGRVEKVMTSANEDLKKIRFAVNRISAKLFSEQSESSVLTTYSDDDKAVWKRLRKELVAEGCSSSVIEQNMDTIKAYVRELCERGLFDEVDVGPNIGKNNQLKNFPENYYPERPVDTSWIGRQGDLLKRPALDRSPNLWFTPPKPRRTRTNLNVEDTLSKNSIRVIRPYPFRNSFEDLRCLCCPPPPIPSGFPPVPFRPEDYKC